MSLINSCYKCTNNDIPTNLIVKELVFNYLGSLDADSFLTDTILKAAQEATGRANETADEVEGLITVVNNKVSSVESSQKATIQRVDNFIDTNVVPIVNNAINNTAVEGGVLADTFVTTTINGVGSVARTQRVKNAESVSVKDFGAKGDGSTDDYPAIMAAINHVSATGNYRQDILTKPTTEVYFPPGDYYCSQEINLKSVVHLRGDVTGLSGIPSTMLSFAEGSNGIIVNRATTLGDSNSVAYSGSAEGAMITGLFLRQKKGIEYAMCVADYNPDTQEFATYVNVAFKEGEKLKIVDDYYGVKTTATTVSTTYCSTFLYPDVLLDPINIGATFTGQTSGATATLAYNMYSDMGYVLAGQVGNFVKGEVVSTPKGTFTISNEVANNSRNYKVVKLRNVVGNIEKRDVITRENYYGSGIVARARCVVNNVCIYDFPFYGVSLIAGAGGIEGNNNGSSFDTLRLFNIGIHGIYTKGGDSNASTFKNIDVVNCSGWGIKDDSFLGNSYYGCHTSTTGGAYYSAKINNSTVFSGCYSEGGGAHFAPVFTSKSVLGRNSLVVGGTHGQPIKDNDGYMGTVLSGYGLTVANGIYPTGNSTSSGEPLSPYSIAVNNTTALSLVNRGTGGNSGVGTGMDYYLDDRIGNQKAPKMKDNSDTVKVASANVMWVGGSSLLSEYQLKLTEGFDSLQDLKVSNTSTGDEALDLSNNSRKQAHIYPVIKDGIIDKLEIVYGGRGYIKAPFITGGGAFNGLTASTKIHGGRVVEINILTQPTNTQMLSNALVDALVVRHDQIRAGKDNISTLGTDAIRFKNMYSYSANITKSIGFWGVNPPSAKPSVTGLKAPTTIEEQNTVMNSLIAALVSYGLITDSRS